MRLKRLLLINLFVIVFFTCNITAFAQSGEYNDVWDSIPHAELNLEEYIDNLDHLSLQHLDELPIANGTRKIESYDVSKSSMIVILFSDNIIAVYDNDFIFQYAISYSASNYYGVLWYKENIALISYRGNCAIVLNENAVPIAMYDLEKNDNLEKDWETIVTSRTRVAGGYTYFCYDRSESAFTLKYADTTIGRHVLERTDENGNTEILYEAKEQPLVKALRILYVPAFVIFCLFFSKVLNEYKKKKSTDYNINSRMDSDYFIK